MIVMIALKNFIQIFSILSVLVLVTLLVTLTGLWLLVSGGVFIHAYNDVNSQFISIQDKHESLLYSIVNNEEEYKPELLLSYRYKHKIINDYGTISCYSNLYKLPNNIGYKALNQKYNRIIDINNFKNSYKDSYFNLLDCLDTRGTGTTGKMLAPNFHYKNGVLVRGSTKFSELTNVNTDTPNIEIWVNRNDSRHALLISHDDEIVKMVYR